jgi:hypothetical protein
VIFLPGGLGVRRQHGCDAGNQQGRVNIWPSSAQLLLSR